MVGNDGKWWEMVGNRRNPWPMVGNDGKWWGIKSASQKRAFARQIFDDKWINNLPRKSALLRGRFVLPQDCYHHHHLWQKKSASQKSAFARQIFDDKWIKNLPRKSAPCLISLVESAPCLISPNIARISLVESAPCLISLVESAPCLISLVESAPSGYVAQYERDSTRGTQREGLNERDSTR